MTEIRPRYADLFAALRDPDPVRADAAFDQILFDRAEALPDLVACYRKAVHDPLLRFYAVQLMGFTEDPRAVQPVAEALDDPDPSVRAEACRALEDLRAHEAMDALARRLDDLDPDVREAAAKALASLRGATDP